MKTQCESLISGLQKISSKITYFFFLDLRKNIPRPPRSKYPKNRINTAFINMHSSVKILICLNTWGKKHPTLNLKSNIYLTPIYTFYFMLAHFSYHNFFFTSNIYPVPHWQFTHIGATLQLFDTVIDYGLSSQVSTPEAKP